MRISESRRPNAFGTKKMQQYKIIKMKAEHVDEVFGIESRSFSSPWSRESIFNDLTKNENAHYFIAEQNGSIAGYAGLWHIVNEGHINNIAVDEPFRRNGIASLLMDALIEFAKQKEMIGITLEVRVGNHAAMGLYHKYGFKVEGIRKNYYSDTKEDAVIMWKYL